MSTTLRKAALVVVCLAAAIPGADGSAPLASKGEGGPSRVEILKTPDGGIQPQAAVDAKGTVHVVYFKGEPSAGDLYYTRLEPGRGGFERPTRVNSKPGSAVAVGTIRGGQIAIGRGGRVHIAWNGSGKAEPKNAFGSTPMLYTRSDGAGGFEPQRNLMRKTSGLDGGGTVAADDSGRVYVAWHGKTEDSREGEMGRRMWVARSSDDGATFAPESPAFEKETGACACCGTRALVDRRGTLFLLYRAATNNDGRDMTLLTSRDRGAHFQGALVDPWKLNACPMSTSSLAEGTSGVLAAWETEQKVYFARLDPKTSTPSPRVAPPGRGSRKHPALAVNSAGETLLVWAEGTGWQKGGALAWQVFDRSDRPTKEKGRVEGGIPVWGLPAVAARPDGGFVIIH